MIANSQVISAFSTVVEYQMVNCDRLTCTRWYNEMPRLDSFQLVFSCEINALGSTYLAQKRRCLVWVLDVARVLYANNPAGNGRA